MVSLSQPYRVSEWKVIVLFHSWWPALLSSLEEFVLDKQLPTLAWKHPAKRVHQCSEQFLCLTGLIVKQFLKFRTWISYLSFIGTCPINSNREWGNVYIYGLPVHLPLIYSAIQSFISPLTIPCNSLDHLSCCPLNWVGKAGFYTPGKWGGWVNVLVHNHG